MTDEELQMMHKRDVNVAEIASETGWKSAIASVVEILRSYAVMMEQGEVPSLSGPLTLMNAARVIEDRPVPRSIANR